MSWKRAPAAVLTAAGIAGNHPSSRQVFRRGTGRQVAEPIVRQEKASAGLICEQEFRRILGVRNVRLASGEEAAEVIVRLTDGTVILGDLSGAAPSGDCAA